MTFQWTNGDRHRKKGCRWEWMGNVQLFTLQSTATNCRINAKRLTNWNSCNSGGMKKYRCLMRAYEKEMIRLASHIGCAHLQNRNGTNKHTHNTNTFQMHQNLKFMNKTSRSLPGYQLMPFIQRPDSTVMFLFLSLSLSLSISLSLSFIFRAVSACVAFFFHKICTKYRFKCEWICCCRWRIIVI